MGEFDHIPTPGADELGKMFEADGGVAAGSIDDLHEAAAREALLAHTRAQTEPGASEASAARDIIYQDMVSAGLREDARAQIRQADSPHEQHLRDVQLNRSITAEAEPADAHLEAGVAEAPTGATAAQAAPAEDRDTVLRSVFQKQLPSYWKSEAKEPAKDPLHRRAARFISSQFRRGKHSR